MSESADLHEAYKEMVKFTGMLAAFHPISEKYKTLGDLEQAIEIAQKKLDSINAIKEDVKLALNEERDQHEKRIMEAAAEHERGLVKRRGEHVAETTKLLDDMVAKAHQKRDEAKAEAERIEAEHKEKADALVAKIAELQKHVEHHTAQSSALNTSISNKQELLQQLEDRINVLREATHGLFNASVPRGVSDDRPQGEPGSTG